MRGSSGSLEVVEGFLRGSSKSGHGVGAFKVGAARKKGKKKDKEGKKSVRRDETKRNENNTRPEEEDGNSPKKIRTSLILIDLYPSSFTISFLLIRTDRIRLVLLRVIRHLDFRSGGRCRARFAPVGSSSSVSEESEVSLFVLGVGSNSTVCEHPKREEGKFESTNLKEEGRKTHSGTCCSLELRVVSSESRGR